MDPRPADSSARFVAGAAARAQPGDPGVAGEGDLGEVTFPDVDDFDVRNVHGYGKVANVEAGMVFLEDRSGILHWKIFRGISVRPLGARTAGGQEAAGDAVTLICPFWVKHKKGQEEKVFLVPFLYMRPPGSHTWALLCTQDELGHMQKVRGVPLSEIGGVVPRTREVGGVDQSTALFARVEAFWLRWEKEARSDMLRKVQAEARKVAEAQGEDVASESSAGGKSSVLPAKGARGRPPRCLGRSRGLSGRANIRACAGALGEQAAEGQGGPAVVPGAGAGHTASCCAWREAAGRCADEGAGSPAWRSAVRPRRHGRRGELGRRSSWTSWRLRVGSAGRSALLPRLWLCQKLFRGGQDLAHAVCR